MPSGGAALSGAVRSRAWLRIVNAATSAPASAIADGDVEGVVESVHERVDL